MIRPNVSPAQMQRLHEQWQGVAEIPDAEVIVTQIRSTPVLAIFVPLIEGKRTKEDETEICEVRL
jgi:hypothetical protein